MTDPRTSTALHHLPVDDPPPPRWAWAVVASDPSGRIQLPAAALDALGTGLVVARMAGGVLVLGRGDGPGCGVGVDRRGRCYLPAWLRRSAVVVAADPAMSVVLVTGVAVLDPIGEKLARAVRA